MSTSSSGRNCQLIATIELLMRDDQVVPDDRTLLIRLPMASWVSVMIFGVLWCGLLLVALVASLRALFLPGVLVPLVMLTLGGLLFYRILNLSVLANDDELVVKNYARTRRIPKADVEDFRIGGAPYGQLYGKSLVVLLCDQTVL